MTRQNRAINHSPTPLSRLEEWFSRLGVRLNPVRLEGVIIPAIWAGLLIWGSVFTGVWLSYTDLGTYLWRLIMEILTIAFYIVVVAGGLYLLISVLRGPLFFGSRMYRPNTEIEPFRDIVEFGVGVEKRRTSHGEWSGLRLEPDDQQIIFANNRDFDTQGHLAFAWAQSDLEDEAIERGEIRPDQKQVYIDPSYPRDEKLIRQFKQ